ncbi:cysteine-rich receptor-like protein kinase 8 [Tanacetum coccineum]
MDSKLRALEDNGTWELTELPPGKKAIGNLFEEVYMKVPLGYAGKGEKVNVDSKLDKSLTDYSLLVKNDNQKFTDILVYVDDLLITGNDKSEIQLLKSLMSSTFHMKDLGDLSYFLGLEVLKSSQ